MPFAITSLLPLPVTLTSDPSRCNVLLSLSCVDGRPVIVVSVKSIVCVTGLNPDVLGAKVVVIAPVPPLDSTICDVSLALFTFWTRRVPDIAQLSMEVNPNIDWPPVVRNIVETLISVSVIKLPSVLADRISVPVRA